MGIAAPGVDIVSTVPGDGQCTDNGTSFAAPYVAGVVALMRAKYPDWTAAQIIARIEQTAERSVNGRDAFVGWGVVDPVRALSGDDAPQDAPTPTHRLPGPGLPSPRDWRCRRPRGNAASGTRPMHWPRRPCSWVWWRARRPWHATSADAVFSATADPRGSLFPPLRRPGARRRSG